jgi:hypothetical protein
MQAFHVGLTQTETQAEIYRNAGHQETMLVGPSRWRRTDASQSDRPCSAMVSAIFLPASLAPSTSTGAPLNTARNIDAMLAKKGASDERLLLAAVHTRDGSASGTIA